MTGQVHGDKMDLADGKPYCPKGLGGKAMATFTVYGYVL